MRKMGKGKISFFEIAAVAFVSVLFLIFSKDRGETALFLIFSLAVIYGLRGRIPAEGAAGKKAAVTVSAVLAVLSVLCLVICKAENRAEAAVLLAGNLLVAFVMLCTCGIIRLPEAKRRGMAETLSYGFPWVAPVGTLMFLFQCIFGKK